VPPPGYLQRIREICDRHDVLFIADEVMCGCGRTGRHFAVEHWDVVPDILVAAKGLASGYAPLAATIVSHEIHDTFLRGSGRFIHGYTYGGNPLSCATGLAVLRLMREWRLPERAAAHGEYLRAGLETLYKHPIVGDVRGKGLMLGIELVKSRETKEPFPAELRLNEKVGSIAFARGLIVYPGGGGVDGSRGDHILLGPPLVITKQEIDELVAILDETLAQAAREWS
jgi:adenosylmethionine-8-amino-7-oxononanoate aminotransferase